MASISGSVLIDGSVDYEKLSVEAVQHISEHAVADIRKKVAIPQISYENKLLSVNGQHIPIIGTEDVFVPSVTTSFNNGVLAIKQGESLVGEFDLGLYLKEFLIKKVPKIVADILDSNDILKKDRVEDKIDIPIVELPSAEEIPDLFTIAKSKRVKELE